MTLPFEPRPDNPAADHLNTLLDAMRSGTRTPDAALPEPTEAAALANAADELRGLVRHADAPAAAYLKDHPLHDRWEDIMSTAFLAAPPNAATGGVFTPSAPVSNRTQRLAEPPMSSRLNTWVSAAIVALMLLGTVGGAWWFGPGRGGPSGNDPVRLAAVTQDERTPPATLPEPLTPEEAPWIAPISPDECTAEPMPLSEYADALTTDPGPLNRSYEITGPAAEDDASAALEAIRGLQGCAEAGLSAESRSYYTDAGLFYLGATADNVDTWDEVLDTRMETGLHWSEWAEQEGVYPVALVTGVEPDWTSQWSNWVPGSPVPGQSGSVGTYWEWRYNPDDAYMLADGRMMVHGTAVYWAEDPTVQGQGLAEEPNVIVMAYVLNNVDGQWLIDEQNIQMCFNDACDQLRNAVGTPAASPVATPDTVTSAPAPLMDLLSAIPADVPGPRTSPFVGVGWVYADVEQQLASMGLTPEEAAADPLRVIGTSDFGVIARTSALFSHSTDEGLIEAIGFHPFTVKQAVTAGAVPDFLTVLRGDWDADTLVAAWEAAGYTEYTTVSGVTVWTLGPDGEVDPDHPIQAKVFQALNNVAILDGGILVYAGTMDTLELALDAHSGEVQSARDDADMAPLLATVPENTVSLFAYDQAGSVLYDLERQVEINPNIRPEDAEKIIEEIRAPFVESREAVGAMPDYHGVIFGIASEPGENGEEATSEVFVRLGAGSEEDATQIATVIEWRWRNFLSNRYQRPLDTVMTLTEATTNGTAVTLTFDPHGNPSIWMDLLLGNDLSPFAVDRGDPGTPVATPEG